MGFDSTAWRRSVVAMLVLLAVGLGVVPAVASAGRVALVVGNGAYSEIVALNSTNDSSAVATALTRLGFDVTLLEDATRDTMNDALAALADASQDTDIALVFYAGHGMETADGRNYLVPVDARLADVGALPVEAVSLDRVVDAIAGARAPIVILDAARNDLFAHRGDRVPESRGERPPWPDVEVLIAYSTLPGGVAGDAGPGDRNSPYTEALLAHLEAPEVEVEVMFRGVAAAVHAATEGRQRPVVTSTLGVPGPIRLADPTAGGTDER